MLITWSKIASRSIYSVTMCVCVVLNQWDQSIWTSRTSVSHNQSSSREAAPAGPRNVDCTWMFHQFMNIYATYTCGNLFSTPIWCQLPLKLSWIVVISGWVSPQALHSMGIPTPKLPRGARCKSWDHLVDWGETVSNCKTCCSLVTWLCLRVIKLTLEGSQLGVENN